MKNKFGSESSHKSGVVIHGTEHYVIIPPSWFEPCVDGKSVGTKHVLNVNFGTINYQDKLLYLATKEHAKGRSYLEQSPPNKSLAHKHLSRAQKYILQFT